MRAPRRRGRPFERNLSPPPSDMVFERGVYLPFDRVELAEVGGAAVTLNGNLALSWVNSTFEATLEEPAEPDDDPELDEASARVGLRGAATLELSLDAGAEVTGSLNLALVPLPAFTVAGEITVSPFVRVRLHLAAAADADARISLVAPFRFGSGFAFDGTTGREGMAWSPRSAPEVGLPDTAVTLTAKVELEVSLALQLTVAGLPIGGPALGTSVGVLLDVDPVAGIDLDGELAIVGGWVPPAVVGELPNVPDELPVLFPVTRVNIVAGGPLIPGLAPTRWSRLFDVFNDDNAAALLPAGDGLVVVESNRIAGIPWLAELDAAGVPVWQSTSGPNDSWTPLALAYALDGDILVAGTGGGVRVDRFSPAGEPRWTRRYNVPDADRTTCIAMTARSTGGAVLAGEVLRSGDQIPLLLAIHANGDVDWALELDPGGGATSPALAGLAQTPLGDILAVGQVEVDDLTDPLHAISRTNAWILRLRADGALVAGFVLGGNGDEKATRVVVHPDGSYAIGGHLSGAPNIWLAALDATDSLRWSSSYRPRPDTAGEVDHRELTGLAAIEDGLLACGLVAPSASDSWLLRADARTGMLVWVKSLSGNPTDGLSTDELSAVVALPVGFAACGRTGVRVGTAFDDLWVVRADRDGMLHFRPDSGLACQCTMPEWRRLDNEHSLHPLTPTAVATTLEIDADHVLEAVPVAAFGELLTD